MNKLSEVNPSSFVSFDKMQILKINNDKYIAALKGTGIKSISKFPIDITVEPSSKSAFIKELDESLDKTNVESLLAYTIAISYTQNIKGA